MNMLKILLAVLDNVLAHIQGTLEDSTVNIEKMFVLGLF